MGKQTHKDMAARLFCFLVITAKVHGGAADVTDADLAEPVATEAPAEQPVSPKSNKCSDREYQLGSLQKEWFQDIYHSNKCAEEDHDHETMFGMCDEPVTWGRRPLFRAAHVVLDEMNPFQDCKAIDVISEAFEKEYKANGRLGRLMKAGLEAVFKAPDVHPESLFLIHKRVAQAPLAADVKKRLQAVLKKVEDSSPSKQMASILEGKHL